MATEYPRVNNQTEARVVYYSLCEKHTEEKIQGLLKEAVDWWWCREIFELILSLTDEQRDKLIKGYEELTPEGLAEMGIPLEELEEDVFELAKEIIPQIAVPETSYLYLFFMDLAKAMAGKKGYIAFDAEETFLTIPKGDEKK